MKPTIYKYRFTSDYGELAHPRVLEALSSVGNTQFEGYGLDEFSERAGDLIKSIAARPSADVHFISGGTHANLTFIASALRPHESVIAPDTGHVFMHETGAIESTGHKVCVVKCSNGKLRTSDIGAVLGEHTDEHMVKPRLVYLSQSSECGTVYNKKDLTEISEYCRRNNLLLYIDGARLGVAVNSPACDLSYADIAGLADAFYIGGTKNGALFGEAIVICADELKADFRFLLKQKGALMAKGAAISVQFDALLRTGLYDELARHSIAAAMRLSEGIRDAGYNFLYPVETNMLFPLFPARIAEKLHRLYAFYDQLAIGDMLCARIVTSWATPDSALDGFLSDLAACNE